MFRSRSRGVDMVLNHLSASGGRVARNRLGTPRGAQARVPQHESDHQRQPVRRFRQPGVRVVQWYEFAVLLGRGGLLQRRSRRFARPSPRAGHARSDSSGRWPVSATRDNVDRVFLQVELITAQRRFGTTTAQAAVLRANAPTWRQHTAWAIFELSHVESMRWWTDARLSFH